jgi:hypothetical protein
VAIGVALGCVCAFLYPEGLFMRPSTTALQWPRHVTLFISFLLLFPVRFPASEKK